MTDKEKKSKIADILMDFQEEYSNEVINRPMLASLYAGNILSFIDSLQEEPISEILLCAADSNSYKYIESVRGVAIQAFKDGAKWQKEQMIAKAIVAVISQVPCSNEIILYNPSSVYKYCLPQEMNKLGLNKGAKVKVVIIKED